MITLYGCYRSRASRPLWLLSETGTPFTHVPVIQAYRLPDPGAADAPVNTASRGFLAVNPIGQIPALVDGDLVLTESLAICLHLARRAGGPLAPKDEAELSASENWALFAATAIEPHSLAILQSQDPQVVEAEAAKLARGLARLEAHLTGRDWLSDRFTVADLMVAECLRYAQGHKPLMEAHPATASWLARCQARPAFQAMWQARSAEPA
ncbi:MAG: glutathione S-transferase [Rhodobacterales bacterium 65-51]|uniref:glutathione S-transferase family protein n=1 Tax=uncultured Gemmobacter sp. TaxID=1095917 RepID=UPI000966A04F|nr:glutathione S-transferase family protein [uncultured Gemmobacter sp.]OJY32680.1 MAG: glutathione S-transferase [Rhodobacterales bacterium 65-51]